MECHTKHENTVQLEQRSGSDSIWYGQIIGTSIEVDKWVIGTGLQNNTVHGTTITDHSTKTTS